ncbi:hypothetical protein ILUMI_00492 [Ignelater luminosus]|uniref:Protein sleepless n=1 Tax=Ignelater luminosus TaxID=2038154 RepID=A0A8K0GL64_IGNLU|nr:hypothetical protein ILUMI_00492 [Ignelater luminosus]
MPSIFITTFLLFLFFESISLRRCVHCRITQYGSCQHPDNYYPPVAYCGATNASCATVKIILVHKAGHPLLSFGDKHSRWAIFKGCVHAAYCNETLKKDFSNFGGNVSSCDACRTDLCNSADSNLINFAKLVVFGVVTVFI